MLLIVPLSNRVLAGWDDVGDWSSLADLIPAELNQPRILGDNNLGSSSRLCPYYPITDSSLQCSPSKLLAVSWCLDQAVLLHASVSTIWLLWICQIPYSSPPVHVHRRSKDWSGRPRTPAGNSFSNPKPLSYDTYHQSICWIMDTLLWVVWWSDVVSAELSTLCFYHLMDSG